VWVYWQYGKLSSHVQYIHLFSISTSQSLSTITQSSFAGTLQVPACFLYCTVRAMIMATDSGTFLQYLYGTDTVYACKSKNAAKHLQHPIICTCKALISEATCTAIHQLCCCRTVVRRRNKLNAKKAWQKPHPRCWCKRSLWLTAFNQWTHFWRTCSTSLHITMTSAHATQNVHNIDLSKTRL